MKKRNLWIVVSVLFSVLAIAFVLWDKLNEREYRYVEVKKLYDAFDMKKEYEIKFKKIESARIKILDSLETQLKILSQQIELTKQKDPSIIAKFQVMRDNYMTKKQQLNEDNVSTVKDYDEKILKQLNQYIEDYGKQHNNEYIFGYGNGGELVYGKEKNNITNEVIQFVNDKYKGLK